MTTRFVIHVQDRTTAGGTVLTTEQQLHGAFGKGTALIGDPVYCPACQTTGKIAADGPRLPMTISGRQMALSDDLCSCKCSIPPRLIAVQKTISMTVSDDPPSAPAQQIAARGVSEDQEEECHAQYERSMDECGVLRAMRGGSPAVYSACARRAFEIYQQCRGY